MENTAPQVGLGTDETSTDNADTLAEKCRTTLEKEYGFNIPLPKSVSRNKLNGKRFAEGVRSLKRKF